MLFPCFCRVARWHIFEPKISIWINFWGFCNGRYWCIIWRPFGKLHSYLVHFPRFGMLYHEKSGNPLLLCLQIHLRIEYLHTALCPVNRVRVARWFVFNPKIQFLVNFVGSCNGRCRYILWSLSPIYILAFYILWTFGVVRGNLVYFFLFWYFAPRKIWQPCNRHST
jgi:hypothetical protein